MSQAVTSFRSIPVRFTELVDIYRPDELALVANKASATRLAFAVLLKVFERDGRFPRSRQEVAGPWWSISLRRSVSRPSNTAVRLA